MNIQKIVILLTLCTLMLGCSSTKQSQKVISVKLTYVDIDKINSIKASIAESNPVYTDALDNIIQRAGKALTRKANPVTNKPAPAPSGDIHDYVSLGPYWWPDESKADGLPWIRKDGEVNRLTRGNNTDQQRAKEFLHDLGYLNLAYLYSDEIKYLEKAKELISLWLVDPTTRMNPNLNYAQGVPGASTGRPFGIIEWENIANVVTAIELLKQQQFVNQSFIVKSDAWFSEYLHWLLTSEIGMQEGATKNNHANWYDFQVIGLMVHLKQLPEATQYTELVKTRRIEPQISPDGAQPKELARTKSVNYSSMNLMALLRVADLGQRLLNVDLLNYQGPKGQSIKAAAQFMVPYVQGQKKWQYKQIGGVEKAFKHKTISSFYVADKLFGNELIPVKLLKKNINYVKPTLLLTF